MNELSRIASVLELAGRRGRTVGSWLDLVRSTGPGPAVRLARAGQIDPGARDALYRHIWSEAASELEGELTDLGGGFLEIRAGGASTRVWQQVTTLDDPVTMRMAFDKTLVHELLAGGGLPAPEHMEFDYSRPGPALDFLARQGRCVVKPASDTGGGWGTTAGVEEPSDLRRASLRAARFGDRLLIERQAPGHVYRLLFLDGELIDVLRNRPPRVTGDGRSTIAALIAAENDRRVKAGGEAGLTLLGIGLDTVFALRRAGMTLSAVPAAGMELEVQTVTNDNRIEDSETFRSSLDESLVAQARAAAEAVGLRLAGVDVITPDPSQQLESVGGVIAEVNSMPGVHHHYLVSDRERATRVAVPVLRAALGRTPNGERETG